MSDVTGLVLTLNGERHLAKTLASLSFCDDLLVVDSGSSDATVAIAQAHGARVLTNPWPGPAGQFRFAFEHIRSRWLVSLDQDEYLSEELSASLQAALRDPGDKAGFFCSRRSFYYDRFLRHSGWYPDRLLRVARLDAVEVHVEPPHYGLRCRGGTGSLEGDIVHYPYASLSEHVGKINYYTQEAAKSAFASGKRSGLVKALGHGLGRFAKIYLLRRGFLDGQAGLILAIHGFFYAFHKYIRLAELERQAEGHE